MPSRVSGWPIAEIRVQESQEVGREDADPVATREEEVTVGPVRRVQDELDCPARRLELLLKVAAHVGLEVRVVLRPQDEDWSGDLPGRFAPRAIDERRRGFAVTLAPDEASGEANDGAEPRVA